MARLAFLSTTCAQLTFKMALGQGLSPHLVPFVPGRHHHSIALFPCTTPPIAPPFYGIRIRPAVSTRHRAHRRPLQVCAALNVVVTGSTKGVGKALAANFVRAGDNVVVCSRDEERVTSTIEELQALAGESGSGGKVLGLPTNVARAKDVAALANYASAGG